MSTILVFSAYYHPHIGGYIRNIHELSKRLVQKGNEIDIITCRTDNSSATDKLDGVNIYRVPSWNILEGTYPIPKPSIKTFRVLLRAIKEDYDLISTQTRFFPTSFIGFVLAKIKGTKLVHTERGAAHTVLPNRLACLIGKIYDHTFGSLIVKGAWKNVGVSNAACRFLQHLGARKTVLVPNGVDITFFRKRENTLREQLRLGNAKVITYVGRLIWAKGAQDLILAFCDVRKTYKDIRLLIVGDGPYRQSLERLAENECREHITFLGAKTKGEVRDILSISDIFVNPSYSEGFGVTLVEAGVMGVAIIATGVGGVKDIIQNDRTGLLVPPGKPKTLAENILKLLHDRALRENLAENASELLRETFDWDVIVLDWMREIIDDGIEK